MIELLYIVLIALAAFVCALLAALPYSRQEWMSRFDEWFERVGDTAERLAWMAILIDGQDDEPLQRRPIPLSSWRRYGGGLAGWLRLRLVTTPLHRLGTWAYWFAWDHLGKRIESRMPDRAGVR